MMSMARLRGWSGGGFALAAIVVTTLILALAPGHARAQTGTIISGSIPQTGGFGIIVFGGGTNDELVMASGCPEETAVFWATSNGEFVTFVPGSDVDVVNDAWNDLFPSGIPANTGLIGRCTDAPTSGDSFTLFSVDKFNTGPVDQVTQTDLRVGEHDGYDRMVFEFAGDDLPGYRIEYVNSAVQCGSGMNVPLQGTAILEVSFRNTVAHDLNGPTVVNSNPTPGFPTLKQIEGICDFEGIVQWAAGVGSMQPFRVFELDSPTRLVIDVKH
jgi:hypothetical protein